MRHTLIPILARKELQREYHVRVLIVFLFMISLAGLVGVASLFPAFYRAYTQSQTQQKLLSAMKIQKGSDKVAIVEKALASDTAVLAALSDGLNSTRFSSVIRSIISTRGNLQLTSLSLGRTSPSTFTIVIQGTSPDRDSLLSFKSRLESMSPGNKVDLPVSELAQSKNIQFSVQVTQSKP